MIVKIMMETEKEPLHLDYEEDPFGIDSPFFYKLSQLKNRIGYVESKKIKSRKSIHLGQFKLFFSELIFLTKYHQPGAVVLYVGAACGYHTAYMADLFPDMSFELWDPGRFMIEDRTNIKIFNQFFTTADAHRYAESSSKILFMCDMRNLEIARAIKNEKETGSHELSDTVISEDMVLQELWAAIIKPVAAYLKFRLPYTSDIKFKYLTGTIYLQPYAPSGMEARLLATQYTNKTIYESTEIDEKMAYFNAYIRGNSNISYQRWNEIFQQYHILDCWDNANAMYILDYYLRQMHEISDDNRVAQLFMDIAYFHYKQYQKKYDVIFIKKNVFSFPLTYTQALDNPSRIADFIDSKCLRRTYHRDANENVLSRVRYPISYSNHYLTSFYTLLQDNTFPYQGNLYQVLNSIDDDHLVSCIFKHVIDVVNMLAIPVDLRYDFFMNCAIDITTRPTVPFHTALYLNPANGHNGTIYVNSHTPPLSDGYYVIII